MSKTLDIDKRIDLWIPAYKAASKREKIICPRCGSDNIAVEAKRISENIGYVLITCGDCKKSGYFSRVDFDQYHGSVDTSAGNYGDNPTLASAV